MPPRSCASARFPLLCAVLLQAALAGAAAAAGVDAPVDVPDDIGLGERLALVAWCNDHKIPVADPTDLIALRRAYLLRTHPDQAAGPVAVSTDRERGDLAAELYRRHGRNPPVGASADDIRALISAFDAHDSDVLVRDQTAARIDIQPHGQAAGQPPPPRDARSAPEASPGQPPAAGPNQQAPAPSPRDQARIAVGIEVGKPFPALAARTIDGAPFELKQWKGKVVLVDVWATWCGPCRRELPAVKAAYLAYHARGLEIIGLSLDSDQAKLTHYVTDQGFSWPQICDGNHWEGPFAKKLAITSIPAAFLIGKDGTLVATDLRGARLDAAIAQLLSKDP